MGNLERSLAKLKDALHRAESQIDISDTKIILPERSLLRAAIFLALHRNLELLSAIAVPFFLSQDPYPLFIVHSNHLEIFPHLQNRSLFLTFLNLALASSIHLLLDETEGKSHDAAHTILRPYLFMQELPPLSDPQIGFRKLEEPLILEMCDGVFTEKELQELSRNLHAKLADDLEKELRRRPDAAQFAHLLKQIEDLGPEAKGQALLTIGRQRNP